MDIDKKTKKIFILLIGFFIFVGLSVFAYKYFFLTINGFNKSSKPLKTGSESREEQSKTAYRIAAYKKHPVGTLTRFFKKTLSGFDISKKNISIGHIVLNVKTPANPSNRLKDIKLNFKKFDILISKDLNFSLIKDTVKNEFKNYALPSKEPLKYYLYSVKGNCLCFYFFYKSRLFLKAVFIVRGKSDGSGFDSIKQYEDSPKIALDIDDVGYDKGFINSLISLRSAITFAIFPYAAFSRQIDLKLHKLGYETIMHTPMEPVDPKLFPGDGALFVSMNKKEIKNKIVTDIGRLPYIDGANNHEGSMFTSDRKKICYAVSVFKKHKLFFMDSLTDDNSFAYRCALKEGLPTAQRDVFIDDKPSVRYIENQLNIAKDLAGRFKRVIVIGHPRSDTVKALIKEIPRFEKEGYKFVPLCEFLR